MILVDFLIDTSGSMGEQAKLSIVRDVAKTLNMYHLIDDVKFSLDIYQWGSEVEPCNLNDITDLNCQKKSDFQKLSEFIKNSNNDFIFIATDGGFSQLELDALKDIDKEKLSKIYIIIIGQEDFYLLQKSQIFLNRIFLSYGIYDLVNHLSPFIKNVSNTLENLDDWD